VLAPPPAGVAGIVESAGIDQRPVHEIAFRVVGIFVGVEHVDRAELAEPQHQAVCSLRIGELIGVGFDLFAVAAEIDGLPHEIALHPRVRIGRAELIGFAAGIAGDAVGIADAETLIDFRIDPEFGALP
jgi:hypothetical protein